MCGLASSTQHTYFEIHPCCCISSSLIFIAEQNYIVWLYLNLFIHSPVDGLLDCFQFETIKNKMTITL